MRRIALCLALLLLSACATTQPVPPPPPPPPPPSPGATVLLDWRAVIRPPELGRLDRLSEAWTHSLNEVRADGHENDLRGLGDLSDPQIAEGDVAPPPGDYRCRTIKLGGKADGGLTYTAYGWFKCRIQRTPKGLKFAKVTGSQRPSGLLFPDTNKRMVLLGSVSLADEPAANSYGAHPDRDIVGVLERLPHGHWRIAMPWPYLESNLDLIELEPAR
jgi:hypothetical protein